MADLRDQSLGEMLLEALTSIISNTAARVLDINDEVAKIIGDEATTRFSDQFGGETYYVPKGRVFRRSTIYRQIYDEFNGSNVRELAKKHGVSLQHMYRILASERERDRSERQKMLPGLPR